MTLCELTSQAKGKIQELIDYWQSKCTSEPFPSRKDIDPSEIPHLLKHTILAEYIREENDFLCRIVGEDIIANTRNIQGMRVTKVIQEVPDLTGIYHICSQIVSSQTLLQGEYDFVSSKNIKKKINYVGLPLSLNEPSRVDMILCLVIFI